MSSDGHSKIFDKRAWVRYADNFVVFCETKDDAEKVVEVLKTWLAERGLSLADDKTRIVHMDQGFDFLGFNVRRYRARRTNRSELVTLITPSRKSVAKVREKLKAVWSGAKHRPLRDTLLNLNAIVRGWSNYFRGSCCAKAFSGLDHWMHGKAMKFAYARHRSKSKRWVVARYFGECGGYRWVFRDTKTDVVLRKFSQTKVVRHVMVRGRSSPDDAALATYWDRRRKTLPSNLSVKHQCLARMQVWKCPICGDWLENEEPLRIHYINHTGQNSNDTGCSETLMHLYCHQQMHHERPSEAERGSRQA